MNLAGSWRSFYVSKHLSEKAAAPWIKPCPEELAASLEQLANTCENKVNGLGVVFLLVSAPDSPFHARAVIYVRDRSHALQAHDGALMEHFSRI